MLSRHLSLLQSDFWQEPIFCLAACVARRLIVSVEQEVVVVFSLQPAAGDIAYIHTARACCDIYPLDNLFDQRVNALWTDLRAMIIRRTPHSGGHHKQSRAIHGSRLTSCSTIFIQEKNIKTCPSHVNALYIYYIGIVLIFRGVTIRQTLLKQNLFH